MTRARILATGLFASPLTLGCAPDNGGNTTQGATTSTTATTSGDGSGSVTSAPGSATDGTGTDSPPTTTATTSTSGTTATSSTGEPCDFLNCDDMMKAMNECDIWAQDCREGQKCTAYIAGGGGAWNSTKCVDVTGADQPGEKCTTDDVASGIDSCIKGAMCFYVDEEGVGTCLALCTGGPEAPLCAAGFFCPIAGDGVLNLCIPSCDPLLQDCLQQDHACYPTHDTFICIPDGSGDEGQANDPCEFVNVCDEGLMCGETGFVGAGCTPGVIGCCTPFCKFPDGPCPNPDQQCVQYFDPMQLPVDDPSLDIGVCGLPG
jgi:hypothetical protein